MTGGIPDKWKRRIGISKGILKVIAIGLGVGFLAVGLYYGIYAGNVLKKGTGERDVYSEKGRVGILEVRGIIRDFGLANKLREKRDSIDALVLKINSRGGYVYSSYQLEHLISEIAKEKPVVAYIGEIGCSGAYFVGSAADKIFARRYSLTAGLGVISTWISYEDYLENEGIEYFVWKSGDRKDSYAFYRDPTENEKQAIQEEIEETAEKFFGKIKQNRSDAKLENVRSGKVIYGKKAKKLNLIDNFRSFNEAKEYAADIAGLKKNFETVVLNPKQSITIRIEQG